MTRRGLFFVDRGVFSHPKFKDEPFTEREAWLWLVAEASYRDRTIRGPRGPVKLARGQLTASTRFMADIWRWKEPRVRRFLERLKIDAENDAMIDASTHLGQTVITLRNYEKFQDFENYRDTLPTQGSTHQSTRDRRSIDANKNQISTPEETPEPKEDNSHTTDADVKKMISAWNEMAVRAGLPAVQKVTQSRRSKAKARLKDAGGIEGWMIAIEKVAASSFLTGQNDRGWKADFDFLVSDSKFTATMEGKYDDTPRSTRNEGSAHTAFLAAASRVGSRQQF